MPARPPHLIPYLILLVFAGGLMGSGARYALRIALPVQQGWPWPTFVANISGAFLLGALTHRLRVREPESSRSRLLRLGLGSGLLSGYTTYSALVVESIELGRTGTALAVTYPVASLALGLTACVAGGRVGCRWRRVR